MMPVIALSLIVAGGIAVYAQPPAPAASTGEVTQGSLLVIPREGEPREGVLEFPLQHTDVQATVYGMVAEVTVTQTFANPFEETIEAIYVFPLPDEAAVNDMTMHIGERTIRGLIKTREEAREIYEEAREAGQTASLLEQERPNIFTQSVANITPGAEIRIEIHYVETLNYDAGRYEFVFPMVVGPRYIPGEPTGQSGGGWAPDTDQVPDASRITPPVLKPEERTGHDIALSLTLDAGVPIQDLRCRSHEVEMTRDGNRRASVSLKPFDTIPNKDFMLQWDVAGEQPKMALLTHREGDSGGYFTLMIQPKARFDAQEIMPREMIFVVDCSGSMEGEPIAWAKQAMRKCIAQMSPSDSFRVIKFSNEASELSDEPLTYSVENIKRALTYIDAMRGEGGTEMLSGIRAALDYPADPERMRIVTFMTDGYIGNDAAVLAEIQKKLGNTRLFSFGVGSSVNRYLLDRMAEVGRGVAQYARPNEEATQFVERFYERIERPFLLDLEIDWGGLQVADVYTNPIPDLFADQPVILKGRYTEPGSGEITLTGRLRGQRWSQKLAVELPRRQPENEALGSIWARARIKDLMDRMYSGEEKKLAEQVTNLALEFRLMSAFTSFVAVEETVVNEGGQQRVIQQPVPMPEGVSYEGVFGAESKDAFLFAAPSAARMSPGALYQRGALGPAGPAGPAGIAGPPGPPGPDAFGQTFGGRSISDCIGTPEQAIIAAGELRDQQRPRVMDLLMAVWITGDQITLPEGCVRAGALNVADLATLPADSPLKAIFLADTGEVAVSDAEAEALRAFIERGGFVIIDGDEAFRQSVYRALSDVEVRDLPADHALLHEPVEIPAPLLQGLYRGETLVGVISETDLSAGWTAASSPTTPEWMQAMNLVGFVAGR